MVRLTQLVVPTVTSFEITSQYLSEATHQVKVEAHSHSEVEQHPQGNTENKGVISKHDQHN